MEEDFISLGLINYIDYNYKSALENFNKAYSKNNDNSEILLYKGICNFKLGSYESAISDLNKSESKGQSGFELFYHRALAYLYNNEVSYAKSDFENAKKQASDNQLNLVNNYLEKLN